MTRKLTNHNVEGTTALEIEVLDEPGAGGACHQYVVWNGGMEQYITFQNGPIAEHGVNGLTNEALLAIVEDRLTKFQNGPFACEENAVALAGVTSALAWLKHRTRERIERGVEGKSEA